MTSFFSLFFRVDSFFFCCFLQHYLIRLGIFPCVPVLSFFLYSSQWLEPRLLLFYFLCFFFFCFFCSFVPGMGFVWLLFFLGWQFCFCFFLEHYLLPPGIFSYVPVFSFLLRKAVSASSLAYYCRFYLPGIYLFFMGCMWCDFFFSFFEVVSFFFLFFFARPWARMRQERRYVGRGVG